MEFLNICNEMVAHFLRHPVYKRYANRPVQRCFVCELQWRLATMVTMDTNECQNIASAIVINFEQCDITLLQTKLLTQNHADQDTINNRLNTIRTQSRSKLKARFPLAELTARVDG